MLIKQFKECCDDFIDFTIRFAYNENKQIIIEENAYINGIINKETFINLKLSRQSIIIQFNKIALKLNNALKNLTDVKNESKLKELCNFTKNILNTYVNA